MPAGDGLPRSVASRLLEGRGWALTHFGLDVLALSVGVMGSLALARADSTQAPEAAVVWLFPLLVVALLALRGMYRPRLVWHVVDGVGHILGATSLATMTSFALIGISGEASEITSLLIHTWVLGTVLLGTGRVGLGLAQRRARAGGRLGTPTLIVGAGRVGAQVERRLGVQPELGLHPLGYLDAHPAPAEIVPKRKLPILGAPSDLEEVAASTGARHVILAFLASRGSDAKLIPLVDQCRRLGLEVSLVPRLFESMNARAQLEHLGGMPLFRMRSVDPKGWHFAVKYAVDRTVAALLLVLLAPALAVAAIAVKLSSPGPVLVRQRRVGRDGCVFDLFKFRSMRLPEPAPPRDLFAPFGDGRPGRNGDSVGGGLALHPSAEEVGPGGVEGADRRTGVGRVLRRTSLDELPQLLNVLKGEMSLIGPRPERSEYVELFKSCVARYNDRHRVKSGITGWAQVHGLRGKTSIIDRIEWDNFYIENWSLGLDFKIMLMTVAAFFHPAE